MYNSTADKLLHSFRLGLLGFAFSSVIREDNLAGGDDGSGNYGAW